MCIRDRYKFVIFFIFFQYCWLFVIIIFFFFITVMLPYCDGEIKLYNSTQTPSVRIVVNLLHIRRFACNNKFKTSTCKLSIYNKSRCMTSIQHLTMMLCYMALWLWFIYVSAKRLHPVCSRKFFEMTFKSVIILVHSNSYQNL